MDNRQAAFLGLFLLASIYQHVIAQPAVVKSTTALNAHQRYTATLPAAFNQAIPFSWQYLPTSPLLASSMGIAWRHTYDIRLLKNEHKLELLKPDGTSSYYSPTTGNLYLSETHSDGSIQRFDQHYHLTADEHTTIFYGSHPVTIKKPDSTFVKLRYKDNVLTTLFDQHGMNFI